MRTRTALAAAKVLATISTFGAMASAADATGRTDGTPDAADVPAATGTVGAPAPNESPASDEDLPGPWGLGAHVVTGAVAEGINQGIGRYPDAGLAGAGLTLRTMLDRRFALQGEGDLLGGLDLTGYPRIEALGLASLLLYLNPGDRLCVFLEGSLGFDVSRISQASLGTQAPTFTYYNMVGGGGVGVELRLVKALSLTGEARGLLRGRMSGLADDDTVMRDGSGHEATTGAMIATMFGGRYAF